MKLRYGYLFSGMITGFIILCSAIWTLPDGKLHVIFCDVGQGDAAYVRFPDGRDLLIDGGPNDSVLACLGRYMPFWDRSIDLVVLTHPQKDHLQGLIQVTRRYAIGSILRSEVAGTSEGFTELQKSISELKIPVRYMAQGQHVSIGSVSLSYLWPSEEQIAKGRVASVQFADSQKTSSDERVLGAQTGDFNDYSLVQLLRYGSFDVLFPGDADDHVEPKYTGLWLGSAPLEILKVPHHGSKTGMTQAFVDWVHPQVSVISVGKNTYGHPSKEAQGLLKTIGSTTLRTDQVGDVEIISDGSSYAIKTQKNSKQIVR